MKKYVALLLVVLMSLSFFAGCGKTETEAEPAVTGDEAAAIIDANANKEVEVTETTTYKSSVKIGTGNDLPSACPYGNSNNQTQLTGNSTHEGLVKVGLDGEPIAKLAAEWSANADSTEWTYKLREGVKFHNGADFTAEDVIFTWDYCSDVANEGVKVTIVGRNLVEAIETPDDYTVVFKLTQPVPDFHTYAAQKILDKGTVEELGTEQGGRIGTGPFYLFAQETGVSWELERFADYWGEAPITQHITFVAIPDASTRALTLRSGDIDAFFDPNASDCVYFSTDSNYSVYKAENLACVWLGLNCSPTSPTSDLVVRQAIAMALNREDVVNACYENGACGFPITNVISSVVNGYVDVDAYAYDPEGAAQLLADNGYKNVTVTLRTYAKYKSLAEVIQASLAMAGITVNIDEVASSGFTGTLMAEPDKYDMYLSAFSSTGGALNLVERFLLPDSIHGAVHYDSAEFVAMYEKAAASTTLEGLLAGYADLQKQLAIDVPMVPVAGIYQWAIGSKNFGGVELGIQPIDLCVNNVFVVE